MSEGEPKPDIYYSIAREEPRATFALPEKFTEASYSYEDVFINELLIEQQPYDLNENSPTPLDPFHLKLHRTDYYTSAAHYMENRLMVAADKIGLADHHRETILNEINHEHLLRSTRNNEAIKQIRASVDPTQPVDPVTAELVLKARAGVITLEGAAYLLAAFSPKVKDIGIEVIKYTGPLMDLAQVPDRMQNDNQVAAGTKFDAAHREFLNAMDQIDRSSSGIIVDSSTAQPQRPRNSAGYGIRNVLVTKGKEADLYVYGQNSEPVWIESVGRYSYYVPGTTDQALRKVKPTMAKIHNKPVAMYEIALSKYLRIGKHDTDREAQ